MTGAQLAGWLRSLADQVERNPKIDGETYRLGTVTVQVAPSSTLRTHKQRHGTLDPPPASNPSHDLLREAIRDAVLTSTETLVRRIRDGVETATEKAIGRGVSAALDTISSLDLKNTTTSKTDRSSRAVEETGVVVVAADETIAGRNEAETRISCPPDLSLLDSQIANLEMCKGVPAHFIRNVTQTFVGKYLGTPEDRRLEAGWRKCLWEAVSGTWDDRKKRDRFLYEEKETEKTDASKIAAQVEASRRRADRERLERRELATGGVRRSEPPPPPKDQAGAVLALIRGIG